MAHATKISQSIRRIERVPRIQLTLTEGEADFLQGILRRVGGDRRGSPRKYADRIAKALYGATRQGSKGTDAARLISGFVTFSPYESDPFFRERGNGQ